MPLIPDLPAEQGYKTAKNPWHSMWLVLLKTSAAWEVGSAEAKPQPWRASLYTDKDSLLNKVWRSLFDSDESTARVNNCSLKMILNTLPAWSLPLFRQVNHLLSCQSHSNLWPSISHALLLFPKLNIQGLWGLYQALPQNFYQVFFY